MSFAINSFTGKEEGPGYVFHICTISRFHGSMAIWICKASFVVIGSECVRSTASISLGLTIPDFELVGMGCTLGGRSTWDKVGIRHNFECLEFQGRRWEH